MCVRSYSYGMLCWVDGYLHCFEVSNCFEFEVLK